MLSLTKKLLFTLICAMTIIFSPTYATRIVDMMFTPTVEVIQQQTEVGIGLQVQAQLVKDGPIVDKGIYWELLSSEKDFEGNYKKILYSSNARPYFNVPAGDYMIRARYGYSSTIEKIHYDPKSKKAITINLNTGVIRLEAILDNGKDITHGMQWIVNDATPNIAGEYLRIASTSRANPMFQLKAGKYQIVAKIGAFSESLEVDIQAGKLIEEKIKLAAGFLRLKAIASKNGQLIDDGVYWTLFSKEPDLKGKHKQLATQYGRNGVAILIAPPGDYLLKATYDKAVKEINVTVKQGEIIDKTVNLDAGSIRLHAINKKNNTLLTQVRWKVKNMTPDPNQYYKYVAYSSQANPIFVLNAGTYIVELSYGNIKKEQKVNVVANKLQDINISLD